MPIRKKFCPRCGKETDKFYENLCGECFLSTLKFKGEVPRKIKIKICRNCGDFFLGEQKVKNLEDGVRKELGKMLKYEEVEDVSYRIFKNKVYLTIWLKYKDLRKREERVCDLVIKRIVCKSCAMKKSGYYRLVLQVRVPENLTEKVMSIVQQIVEKLRREDKLSFISKVEKMKNGFNVYLGSRRVGNKVVRAISQKYKTQIKRSREYVGMEDGRPIFRETILLRIK